LQTSHLKSQEQLILLLVAELLLLKRQDPEKGIHSYILAPQFLNCLAAENAEDGNGRV